MLKKLAADEVQAQLAVADSKLGGIIRECKSFFKDKKITIFSNRFGVYPLAGNSRVDSRYSREFERNDGHSRVREKRNGTWFGPFPVTVQTQIQSR